MPTPATSLTDRKAANPHHPGAAPRALVSGTPTAWPFQASNEIGFVLETMYLNIGGRRRTGQHHSTY